MKKSIIKHDAESHFDDDNSQYKPSHKSILILQVTD